LLIFVKERQAILLLSAKNFTIESFEARTFSRAFKDIVLIQ